MALWGLKVKELLDEQNKSAAWLARETGIARSTISNWLNNPDGVIPHPDMVAKVAKAFGKTARELAPYGGYPIITSADEGAHRARLQQLAASPRLAHMMGVIEGLSATDQDTVISMVEAFIARGQRARPKSE